MSIFLYLKTKIFRIRFYQWNQNEYFDGNTNICLVNYTNTNVAPLCENQIIYFSEIN
jgi:hypothetical protein